MDDMPYTDALGRVYKYGEFFPSELSPFAYNETLLNDQFPSNKEGAQKDGFVWRDENKKEYETTLLAKDLPESIADAEEKITQELIACGDCGRAYRITPSEFQFLKNSQLPLPRSCFNCRFARRQKYMVPPLLKNSQCQCGGINSLRGEYLNTQQHEHGAQKCPNLFETAYNPEKEIIYCEACYKKEVF